MQRPTLHFLSATFSSSSVSVEVHLSKLNNLDGFRLFLPAGRKETTASRRMEPVSAALGLLAAIVRLTPIGFHRRLVCQRLWKNTREPECGSERVALRCGHFDRTDLRRRTRKRAELQVERDPCGFSSEAAGSSLIAAGRRTFSWGRGLEVELVQGEGGGAWNVW